MLARIRKAVVAGVGAGLAAGVAALIQSSTEGVVNRDEVSKAIGLGVAAAVTVGIATYKTPNAALAFDPSAAQVEQTREYIDRIKRQQ